MKLIECQIGFLEYRLPINNKSIYEYIEYCDNSDIMLYTLIEKNPVPFDELIDVFNIIE